MKNLRNKGITLLELLIALVIIGTLVAFAAEFFTETQETARKTKVKSDLEALKTAMVGYTSDEYNVDKVLPKKLNELVNCEFKYVEELDTSANSITRRPAVPGDPPGMIKIKKRHFIEKIPTNPIGPAYYADSYYVYGEIPGRPSQIKDLITGNSFNVPYAVKVPYKNAAVDDISTGVLAPEIYRTLVKGSGTVVTTRGSVTLTANNSSASPSDTATLYTVPIKMQSMVQTGPMPGPAGSAANSGRDQQNKFIFEVTFKYSQVFGDTLVLSSQENRILDPSAISEFKKANNGCVFFFKNSFPATDTLTEGTFKTKSGIGFVFSKNQWELYESPTGGAISATPVAGGGMDENATHQIKFVLKASNMMDCYLDGDFKGTAKFGPAGDIPTASLAVAADLFSDAAKTADCKMVISQIKIGCADFSLYYKTKIR